MHAVNPSGLEPISLEPLREVSHDPEAASVRKGAFAGEIKEIPLEEYPMAGQMHDEHFISVRIRSDIDELDDLLSISHDPLAGDRFHPVRRLGQPLEESAILWRGEHRRFASEDGRYPSSVIAVKVRHRDVPDRLSGNGVLDFVDERSRDARAPARILHGQTGDRRV